jgi:hypothetical protein
MSIRTKIQFVAKLATVFKVLPAAIAFLGTQPSDHPQNQAEATGLSPTSREKVNVPVSHVFSEETSDKAKDFGQNREPEPALRRE